MKSLSILLCSVLLLLVHVKADIVVFVHGLAGFGPDELFGLGYWGFSKVFTNQDYLQSIRNKGHQVFYASVGPISSNWDRACELYAQIKGTRVDYGQAHSNKFGHNRFGTDYTGRGFYPSWDGSRKIHFVGHSMGGNTIRMLEFLLQNGASEEVAASGSGVSNLFKTSKPGGGTWIQSITTISTPHDGSTLHTKLGGNMVKWIKDFAAVFAGVMGLIPNAPDWFYNLDLDQFGLVRKSGESFSAYFNRVFSASIFRPDFKDLASWDLSPESCREFNRRTRLAYDQTYYFSVSTSQTHSCWFGDQCPDIDIEALMGTTAALLGDVDGLCDSTGYCFGNEWEENDGMVPVRSSKSPQNGITGYVEPLSWSGASSYVKGRWYNRIVHRDHVQIIGFRLNPLTFNSADGIYDIIANTIDKVKLPAGLQADEEEAQAVESSIANPSAIAGVSLGVLGVVVLVAVGVVAFRRRRHQRRMVSAFSSKPARSEFASPRKFTKKQIERGSITLQPSDMEAENPAFRQSEVPIEPSEISTGGLPVILNPHLISDRIDV